MHWDVYYYTPTGMSQAVEAAGKLAALHQEKGSAARYRVYTPYAGFGPEVPFLIVSTPARDMNDLAARQSQNAQRLGAEEQVIRAQLASFARRVEKRDFTIRQDLSYQAPN